MRRIFRFSVGTGDGPRTFNISGDPIAVGCRDPREVDFWAIDDDDAESALRTFIVVGTGHALTPDMTRHWGTVIAPGGRLVWHLMEVTT